jgi:predicted RNA-binding protein (virulence factor B family)
MNVYPWLRTDSPYKAGDQVSGVVYETSRNFGAFVAVDSIYSALIPRRELVRELKAGEVVQARVTGIKPDGKIDLSIREKGYLQIDADVEAILNMLNEGGGMIPFTDKAAPELIREKTHMSKNEFKRAVGHLLKENKISIEDDRIVLL